MNMGIVYPRVAASKSNSDSNSSIQHNDGNPSNESLGALGAPKHELDIGTQWSDSNLANELCKLETSKRLTGSQ